jgi:hypothetical protein
MKVVWLSSLSTGRLYSPGNIPGTRLCYRLVDPRAKVRPELGIEPATSLLVAQCLNKLRHRVAPLCTGTEPIFKQLKYACLILNTYHPDTTWAGMWGSPLFFGAKKGPWAEQFGKHCCRRFGTAWRYKLKVSKCSRGMLKDGTDTLFTYVVTSIRTEAAQRYGPSKASSARQRKHKMSKITAL